MLHRVDEVAADGWACWAFSNHDVVRHATPLAACRPPPQRMFATLIMCLRGSVCLYQGEELGLPEADVAFEDLHDPYGIEFWPEFKGRDGCRTPMVWERVECQTAASAAARQPGCRCRANTSGSSVGGAGGRSAARCCTITAGRSPSAHAHPALANGAHGDLAAEGNVVSFTRSLRRADADLRLQRGRPDRPHIRCRPGQWTTIGTELGGAPAPEGSRLHLQPWQPWLALKRRPT